MTRAIVHPPRMLRTFLCAALFIVSFPSFGLARVRVGVESGMNFSWLAYEKRFPIPSMWETGWRTSFTQGASLEIPLRGRFALATGLRYVQQGNRVRFDTGPGSPQEVGEFRLVQNYLSMPVLLECRPLPSRRFFISAGPEIGLLLSGRLIVEETVYTGGAGSASTEYSDIKSILERTNWSLDAGAGFEFPMENHVGVLGLRYTQGLTEIARKDAWVVEWKTRGVEVFAGMRW